ncbi:BPHL, partial [Symbiodinium pilosum]
AWVYACFFCWLVATIKLVYCLCDTCAVARYPGICNYLQSALVCLVATSFMLLGLLFTDMVSQHSLLACIVHACVCTLVAVASCGRRLSSFCCLNGLLNR